MYRHILIPTMEPCADHGTYFRSVFADAPGEHKALNAAQCEGHAAYSFRYFERKKFDGLGCSRIIAQQKQTHVA
jgi:hypothetical protein